MTPSMQILKLAHLLGLDEGEESFSMEGVASGWGQKMPEGHGYTVILVAMAALEVSLFLSQHWYHATSGWGQKMSWIHNVHM